MVVCGRVLRLAVHRTPWLHIPRELSCGRRWLCAPPTPGASVRAAATSAAPAAGAPAAIATPTAAAASANASNAPPPPGKLRAFFNEYGRPGFAIYIGVYLTTLSTLFGLVEYDILSAGDAIGFLKSCGAERVLPEGA